MTESTLAIRAQAGDLEAFGELVELFSGQARRVARAVLGDPDDGDDAA
ncbi:MAG: RNA polymerase sigma factor, partial [Gemmatimonadetes bacterium]|nr:RNA polymerase sigma factor [Gemmatimonadota bacterium]